MNPAACLLNAGSDDECGCPRFAHDVKMPCHICFDNAFDLRFKKYVYDSKEYVQGFVFHFILIFVVSLTSALQWRRVVT
jgi:hypothetical protein